MKAIKTAIACRQNKQKNPLKEKFKIWKDYPDRIGGSELVSQCEKEFKNFLYNRALLFKQK